MRAPGPEAPSALLHDGGSGAAEAGQFEELLANLDGGHHPHSSRPAQGKRRAHKQRHGEQEGGPGPVLAGLRVIYKTSATYHNESLLVICVILLISLK